MLTPAPSRSLAWPEETGSFEHKVLFLGLFGRGFVERKSYDLSGIRCLVLSVLQRWPQHLLGPQAESRVLSPAFSGILGGPSSPPWPC